MNYIDVTALAFIQAATEFLPVSSSGHLQIYKSIFGTSVEFGLAFDIVLHFGTMLATVFYFRKQIIELIRGMIRKKAKAPPQSQSLSKANYGPWYLWCILIASIPIGVVGLLYKEIIENTFSNMMAIGMGFVYTSILLFFMYFFKNQKGDFNITLKMAIVVGLFQMVSICPGISRSASCILAGLLAGGNRRLVGEFAFLISLPAISGATLLSVKEAIELGLYVDWIAVLTGLILSFGFGWFFLSLLMSIFNKGKLYLFGGYTMILALYCFIAG